MQLSYYFDRRLTMIHTIFRQGIKVAGISGDGDIRILNSMIFNLKFNSPTNNNQWFDGIVPVICFLQDIVHIGTKLRNRLLNSVVFLTIGNKIASVAHSKILINKVPKAVHSKVPKAVWCIPIYVQKIVKTMTR